MRLSAKCATTTVVGGIALVALSACGSPTEPRAERPAYALTDSDVRGSLEDVSTPVCTNAKGTGVASGSAIPDTDGRISATGPITGDLTGTLTIVRDATAGRRNGNGATFLTYDEAVLDSDELGTFTGVGNASVNFGLLEEGTRTQRGLAHLEFTGPGSRQGLMKLVITFDLSGFPIISASYRYQSRLCEG